MMIEIDDGVPLDRQLANELASEAKREATLKLARSIYAAGNVGKSTAAKEALKKVGLWAVIERQSAVDYLRNNI